MLELIQGFNYLWENDTNETKQFVLKIQISSFANFPDNKPAAFPFCSGFINTSNVITIELKKRKIEEMRSDA